MDDFVELDPPKKASAAVRDPVTVAVFQMGKAAPKLSITVSDSIMAAVGWPRYSVAWSRDRKQFRIRAAADGKFEGSRPPPGRASGAAVDRPKRVMLRVPLPSDLAAIKGFRSAAHYTLNGKDLIVSAPSALWSKSAIAAASPLADVSGKLMGDPAPGRSALAGRAK